jgi:NAD(P)-dependent dehydrogenase (short-subunit alcohol dehydrogenase family)
MRRLWQTGGERWTSTSGGPVLGVRAFLPGMLASTEPGVIVNVGSKQGISAALQHDEGRVEDLHGSP